MEPLVSGCHENLKINKSRELELKYGRLNKSAVGEGGMKGVGSFFEKKNKEWGVLLESEV